MKLQQRGRPLQKRHEHHSPYGTAYAVAEGVTNERVGKLNLRMASVMLTRSGVGTVSMFVRIPGGSSLVRGFEGRALTGARRLAISASTATPVRQRDAAFATCTVARASKS